MNAGFESGDVTWFDETDNNRDYTRGSLPDIALHKYSGTSVTISYCCREDGFPGIDISLPNKKPFLLYKKKVGPCQAVKGMLASQQFFQWDLEDSSANKGQVVGEYPYGIYSENIRMFYCYYKPTAK